MRKVWMLGLATAVALFAAGSVDAHGWKRGCEENPGCGVQVTYVDKVVTCYKTQMVEKEIDVTCNKLVPREVVNTRKCTVLETEWKDEVRTITCNKLVPREVVNTHKCTVMVPEWKDEVRTVTCNKMVARQVEREVQTCQMVTTDCVDPCTGCCRKVCKPCYTTQKVMTTVYDCVPETKQVTVKVCQCTPVEKEYTTKCMVYDCVPTTEKRKVMECQLVPYQTTIKVPVCTPVAPTCNTVASCAPPAPCATGCCK
jgi:hypothetical protein